MGVAMDSRFFLFFYHCKAFLRFLQLSETNLTFLTTNTYVFVGASTKAKLSCNLVCGRSPRTQVRADVIRHPCEHRRPLLSRANSAVLQLPRLEQRDDMAAHLSPHAGRPHRHIRGHRNDDRRNRIHAGKRHLRDH